MKKNLFVIFAVLFTLTFTLTASAQSDLKIKMNTRMDFPGMPTGMKNPQTGEEIGKMPPTTVLIKGPRMLTERRQEIGTKSPIISTLRQCDLGRDLSYNSRSKKYTATYFDAGPKQAVKNKPVEKESGGGTVVFSIAYTDTGERQQILGYTARHVKSVMTTAPSPDACNKKAMRMETDAWHIDLPAFSCPMFSPPEPPRAEGEQGCSDKMIFKVVGNPDNGFAVKETMTIFLDGGSSMKMIKEATEISKTELDAQLFDIPPGYTEDTKMRGGNPQNSNTQNDTYSPPPAAPDSTLTPPASMPAGAVNSDLLAPKRKGVIRIGIAMPSIKIPDKDDATGPMELSAAVRDSLVESLKTETVEAVRLSTDATESEAKQKECDYIFYANVTQKRGGGGMFGKMLVMGALTVAGSMVPGVGGMIAGTVGSIAMSQTMGKMSKAKDEFTLDYRVVDAAGALLSQAVTKAKTKADGEDVLTPQLKLASATVLTEINKKRS
jgi:uncharacterized membrane protein